MSIEVFPTNGYLTGIAIPEPSVDALFFGQNPRYGEYPVFGQVYVRKAREEAAEFERPVVYARARARVGLDESTGEVWRAEDWQMLGIDECTGLFTELGRQFNLICNPQDPRVAFRANPPETTIWFGSPGPDAYSAQELLNDFQHGYATIALNGINAGRLR